MQVLTDLVDALPASLADGSFRAMVDARAEDFAPLAVAIESEQDELILERVSQRDLGHKTSSWW